MICKAWPLLEGLTFGWRTAVLTVAVAQLLLLAAALLRSLSNRPANRILASLLVVMALILVPWLIGFAAFYDKWRWLTFAPFQITLAVVPLGWLYLRALTEGALPAGWWRHLVPAAAQTLYLGACFAARWLSAAMLALGLLFAVWSGHLLWDLVSPLGFRGLMGLYLAIAATALYLGIEGWRHAALPFPHLADLVPAPASEPRDWMRATAPIC